MTSKARIIGLQIFAIALPATVIYLWFNYVAGNVQIDRIESASGWIVQIDSFLTAGFAVGIFWFWENSSKRLASTKLPIDFRSIPLGLLMSPFVWFSLSAFLAIACILTADLIYLEFSLWLATYAIINAFNFWHVAYTTIIVMDSDSSKKGI